MYFTIISKHLQKTCIIITMKWLHKCIHVKMTLFNLLVITTKKYNTPK